MVFQTKLSVIGFKRYTDKNGKNRGYLHIAEQVTGHAATGFVGRKAANYPCNVEGVDVAKLEAALAKSREVEVTAEVESVQFGTETSLTVNSIRIATAA